MRRVVLPLAVAGVVLIATATGCVTRTPVSSAAGTVAQPSFAADLPVDPESPVRPATSVPGRSPESTGTSRRPAAPGPAVTSTRTGRSTVPPSRTGRGAPPAATATATRAHGPTTAQLRAALLGPDDLNGFQVDDGTGDSGDSQGSCPALDTDHSDGAGAKAEVLLYHSSSTEPVFIRERVRHLGESRARTAIRRVRDAPRSCGDFTTTVEPLGEVTVTVRPLGTPPIGDEVAAVRISLRPRTTGLVGVENLVLVRHGGALIILSHTGLSSIDDRLTGRAVARASAKIGSV